MNFQQRLFWFFAVLVLLSGNCNPTGPGSERWTYRLIEAGRYYGAQASVVACGSDGTVYAAGQFTLPSSGELSDSLEVVALTADGTERYRYRASGFANGLAVDGAGDLYVAGGASRYTGSGDRFQVCRLDPTGTERWVYRHAWDSMGAGGGSYATSVVCGGDGNVYAAGSISGVFSVVSLTAGGEERWTYQPAGVNPSHHTAAQSLLWGSDGNLYVGGTLSDTAFYQGMYQTFTSSSAVSLTPGGAERWTYRRGQPDAGSSYGSSLVQGTDGNLYLLCSFTRNSGNYESMAGIASLTLEGLERWTRDYVTSRNMYGGTGRALAKSADQGVCLGTYVSADTVTETSRFSVASLDADGQQRWLYSHSRELAYPAGMFLTTGDDGNLYCAGDFSEAGGFSLASLNNAGGLRWEYRFATGLFGGPGAANCVAWSDGNVYAGGYANGYNVGQYFLVVALDAGSGGK